MTRPVGREFAAARLVAMMLAFCAACGDADRAEERATTLIDVRDPAAAGFALEPGTTAVPGFLATACLVGDPLQGHSWSLDSVPLVPLAWASLTDLASRDSAQLAVRIARMVDILPSDSSTSEFRELPVTVHAAWRIVPAVGDTIFVAVAGRRVPIESAPREERVTVIASPDTSTSPARLVAGWMVRDIGEDDDLVARELAGAYVTPDGVMLALVEEVAAGTRLALLVRRAGRWVADWVGSLPECVAR